MKFSLQILRPPGPFFLRPAHNKPAPPTVPGGAEFRDLCSPSAANRGGGDQVAELLGILGDPDLLGLAVDVHVGQLKVHVEDRKSVV